MTDAPCPQQNELLSYLSGLLDEERSDKLSLHIDTCAICNETVSTLNPGADPLVVDLQQAAVSSFSAEPECNAAINAIADLSSAGSVKKSLPAKSPFTLPKTIREYRLIEQIGRGGMGAVFKAEHVRLKRLVAVKVLLSDRLQDDSAIARFNREMEAVGKLDHPNIVRATDAGEDEDTNYLVMELVDGPNLSQVSKTLGPIGIAEACELVRQAAAGLQHACEHGLVHRDIKPSNLILADARSPRTSKGTVAAAGTATAIGNATVKILDLGLALLRENPVEQDELTGSGQIMGTLDYMAPEQASDTHTVDIRADIYSLGCTLYHLLAGSAPFSGSQYSTILKKMMAHAQTPVPSLSDVRADVPAELMSVLDKMLAKEPADRFSTPAEVAAALQPFETDSNLCALLDRCRAANESVEHLDTQLQSTITPVSSSLSDTLNPVVPPEPVSAAAPPVLKDSAATSTPFSPTIIIDSAPQSFATKRRGGGGIRRRTWQLLAALGGVLLLGIVFFVGTGEGRIEITVNHPDVQISVDGQSQQIRLKDGANGEYRIELPNIAAGRREIVVTRDGFSSETRHFWITRNGTRVFEMRLVPEASAAGNSPSAIASRNDKATLKADQPTVSNDLGPVKNIISGLIPRPAAIPGIKRWNLESRAIRTHVRSIAYSPDGELLACGTLLGRVRIYNARTGELVNVLSDKVTRIRSLDWSPDSQILAVGWQSNTVQAWSRNGQFLWEQQSGRSGEVDIEWSRDGAVLAAVCFDKIQFLDPQGKLIQQIEMPGKRVMSVSLAPDGQRFVTGSESGDVEFWHRDSGLEVSHEAHRGKVEAVKWSPTGDVIATGGGDGKVRLWNADGTLLATLNGHKYPVMDIDWHPTGDSILSVDSAEVICHWSKNGELLETRQSPAGRVPQAIAWAPNGESYCVSGSSHQIVHLPESDTTPDPVAGHDLPLTDLKWNAAGTKFATGGGDSLFRVFTRNALPTLFIRTHGTVTGLAWSPDEMRLATSQDTVSAVTIWDLVTRREVTTLKPKGGFSPLYSLTWNTKTDELAVGSSNGSATIWSLSNTASPLQRKHSGIVFCAEWVPNSSLLVTAGEGADVQIGAPGKGLRALRSGKNWVTGLRCSPDGKHFAAISDNSMLDVWQTDGTRITSRISDFSALADPIDWSRDSKTLFLATADGRLVRSDIDGTVLQDVPLHHARPTAIAVHRDGRDGLSADNAGTIIKWSTETLDPEWVLVTMPEGESLQFSASGEFMRGDRNLFEREFVYVIEDETGQRHLLTPSEFKHRRSLPGKFSVSDKHTDQRLAP